MTLRCAIQLKRGIEVVKHNYTYVVVILTASQASYFNEPNRAYLQLTASIPLFISISKLPGIAHEDFSFQSGFIHQSIDYKV